MWPYLAGSILIAYMASVKVYKIWYIVTAAVLLVLPLFVRISWLGLRDFLEDAKWFILYWIAVALSVVFSINPARSQTALMADAIYPCVFLIFYTVAICSAYDSIERMMRLLVWAAVLVLLINFDAKLQGQNGHWIGFVLPYVVPFVVSAICRGNRLAIAELMILASLVLLTNSRAQVGVTFLVSVASFVAFSKSIRQLLALSTISVLGCVAFVGALTQIHTARNILLVTVARLTGLFAEEGERPFGIPIADPTRGRINDLFWSMFGDGGWTGIGYFAFGPIYVAHYDGYADMSLHSIYQVWWLETGYLGTAAAAWMLIAFFVEMYRNRGNPAVRACALGMVGVLIAGNFHQMHQSPMFYVMLGLGLGAARKLRLPAASEA